MTNATTTYETATDRAAEKARTTRRRTTTIKRTLRELGITDREGDALRVRTRKNDAGEYIAYRINARTILTDEQIAKMEARGWTITRAAVGTPVEFAIIEAWE